ncbi:hypothetical protein RHA1_ro11254 (plasmid) [Rhodococcus jostii RHA1]|uniref:Uncharacterized protein n=1 Tax=Rhodococcus jostii (strain RHA1) TaxID=101510 RepID=Q0RUY5_RHOJR|nr:hypothetical protein RHA1_ro11254 [Rhodococcus jostii RHA1]
MRQLRIPDDVAATRRGIVLLDTDCERVVYRASVQGDDLSLPAGDDEIEELIGYVAADANHEPNRRRQRLDAAFTVLSEAAENPHSPPPTLVAAGDSTGHVPPRPGPAVPGSPELDIGRVQRWCGARVPEHARHQVRLECEIAARHLTIIERRAPMERRRRTGVDQPAHRPAPLHQGHQDLEPVLARPQSPLPRPRPAGAVAAPRTPADRTRPGPDIDLLGLTNPTGAVR